MIVCPNCGSSNQEGSRFCSNCGTNLVQAASRPAEPESPPAIPESPPATPESPPPSPPPKPVPAIPPPVAWSPPISDSPSSLPPTSPEWRMSDPGPLPEPPRRRRWLWIAAGIVGACLLVCCLVVVWAETIGSDVVNDFATRIAEEATEQAEP